MLVVEQQLLHSPTTWRVVISMRWIKHTPTQPETPTGPLLSNWWHVLCMHDYSAVRFLACHNDAYYNGCHKRIKGVCDMHCFVQYFLARGISCYKLLRISTFARWVTEKKTVMRASNMKLRNMTEGCADLQNEWCWFALLETPCSMEYLFFPDNEVCHS